MREDRKTLLVGADAPAAWPRTQADVGVVLFDPPRLFHDRERALWTPTPQQLPWWVIVLIVR